MCNHIIIRNASENNLRSVCLEIPKNRLTLVTGVSGSGKSSLVFDVLYREAESRYLGSFSANARQFLGKMKKPDVEMITGLSPAIAVKQGSTSANPRSTVGTITGIYDHLRLLFARIGTAEGELPLHRSLFSFNSPEGACPACKGLGIMDRLDPDLLISDPAKSLREGCLVITAPNGYIIYSQVTMDVLDQVCRSEGFHTGIPWQELTDAQKKIVLYGSDKIEIPFGKHPLESRMKWSGITAKPREIGYYKGIIPIMEAILQRDRNKNILRFVRSGECPVCKGSRLNEKALSVKIANLNIADLAAMQLDDLQETLEGWRLPDAHAPIARPIIHAISKRITMLGRLGLDYLSLDRGADGLAAGESRRLKLAAQALNSLSGLLFVFDEPSIGMHPQNTEALIGVLKELRDKGNTVVVVEHDEAFIRHADWLIDIGPGSGIHGGEVLLQLHPQTIRDLSPEVISRSRTLAFYTGKEQIPLPAKTRKGTDFLRIMGAMANNLKNIDVEFLTGAMNVVAGVAGAGKHTLTHHTLANFLRNKLTGTNFEVGRHREITGWEAIKKLIEIDQTPIGRTPRSNPATYTGMFDHIRDLFAAQPESLKRGMDKSRFSFNTAGGRCEACEGAGYQQIGMHFMGNVELLCETCEGRRFDDNTLAITYKERKISEVLEMRVSDALDFFAAEPKIRRYLETLDGLGLGYLTLGQRSSTLSGGEAQRIKLAAELARPASAHTLYILDEPTTGLHQADIINLLPALNRLVDQGNTLIIIEHHPAFIASADRVIELGRGSGRHGGEIVSIRSGMEMEENRFNPVAAPLKPGPETIQQVGSIRLKGVTTHNLKKIDVEIPSNQITVLTGVSGSGKSSLAFDTIYAEGQNRFLESFSTYVRTRLGVQDQAHFEEITGLTATFAVDQRMPGHSPRSTVGTMTGIYDLYRLLYARVARIAQGEATGEEHSHHHPGAVTSSSLFSFNHLHGACPVCDGLGTVTLCDAGKLITHPRLSLLNGAMDGTKTGKFYGDPFGQYIATLKAVGLRHDLDLTQPWDELPDRAKSVVLDGTGDEVYSVAWQFKRNERTGEHQFSGPWPGLIALVNEEYKRKHADHRGEGMMNVMTEKPCSGCHGSRLNNEALQYLLGGLTIAGLSSRSVVKALNLFSAPEKMFMHHGGREIAMPLMREVMRRLQFIDGLGLGYLSIDRPSSGLSGGETQRIKLAAQLGSGLTGITYVLDEPTIGLHPSDIASLMKQIRTLQQEGNTIVMVEHDRSVILAADHVIDMGPGPGEAGGRVLAAGTPQEIMANPASVTGPHLLHGLNHKPSGRILKRGISVGNAHANNLTGFDIDIPAGGIVAVTGVSGSGKSSLVFDVIHASHMQSKPVGCSSISGFSNFSRVVAVQPKSKFFDGTGVPATFTGMFDRIRTLFSATEAAVSSGFGKNHFSFMNREGRCETCQGTGEIRISMDFLSDVWIACEDCGGKRFRGEILSVKYQNRSIGDILGMTFTQARSIFGSDPVLERSLRMMEKVGLGYLHLGQSLNTLSGGEAQRLFLATELMKPVRGNTLYLFEEPSTGLHFSDIAFILDLFNEIADRGDTIIMIEHDPDVISIADHIIRLGPGGGDRGGQLLSAGT